MHPEKWYEWFIQTQECLNAHPQPGSCVGFGGATVLALFGLVSVAMFLGMLWMGKNK